jgi:hypothetical protein
MPRLGNQYATCAGNWIVEPDDNTNGVRYGDRDPCSGRSISRND